ncbi:MAG: ECF transporter S component, partial [Clostridia bacterium]|nr:ECF transporter S component [Clostridia bacterium]
TKYITRVGMLAAAAVILQYLGSLIGLKVAGFLDVEISDYPAILGTLALGPMAGVFIEFIKNLLHLAISHTGFVGELANFLITGSFVFAVGIIYKNNKTKKGAMLSLAFGVIALCVAGIVFNTTITLPLYMPQLSLSERIFGYVFPVITPFNFVKGIVLSIITILTYKQLSPFLHKQ